MAFMQSPCPRLSWLTPGPYTSIGWGEESIREPFVTSSSGVRVQLPKSYDAKLVVRAVQSFCRSYTNARTFEVVFRSCKKSKLPRISSPFVVSVGDERIKYGMIDAEHLRTYIFSGCPLVWGNRRTVIFGDGSFLADLGPMNAQDEKHKTSEVVNRFFCMVDVLTVDSRVDIMSSTDFMANLERNEWIRLIESLWSIKSLQKYNSRASRERSRS